MEAALREALRLAGDQPDIVAGTWEARTFASLVDEHRAQALAEVEMAIAATRGLPATTPGPYRGLWPLLLAVEGKESADACADLRGSGATILPINRAYLAYAEAIGAARDGRTQAATAAVIRANGDLAGRDWFLSVGLRLVGEVALQEGWGHARWIEDAHRYFAAHGYERLATACAALLRRAGHHAPKSKVYRDVPEPLRSLGVTRREMDVLIAVSEGLSNREIGERLYLSPRTVEKHVASLLAKTETRARAQLAALAATTSTSSA